MIAIHLTMCEAMRLQDGEAEHQEAARKIRMQELAQRHERLVREQIAAGALNWIFKALILHAP